MSQLTKLMNWYASNCNEDWEHSFGVKIDTIDNPGWVIKIDLNETQLENLSFNEVVIERSSDNWLHCSKDDSMFLGVGGANNLEEIITVFFDWVEKGE